MKDAPHNARITGPIPIITETGQPVVLPVGPCLIEQCRRDVGRAATPGREGGG